MFAWFYEWRIRMFNKLLQSIGIGSARVDTVLSDTVCVPGGSVAGEVRVYGGNAPQEIETIYLSLMASYEVEVDDAKVRRTADLNCIRLTDKFSVQANQELVMPFSIPVPLNTPVSAGKSQVWVQTGLDIKSAVDPQDRDPLEVRAHPLVDAFIAAAQRLGLRLYQVDCAKTDFRNAGNGLPFVQKFEFKTFAGEFHGKLDEVEAVFLLSDAGVRATLQIDRRVRGFASMLSESMGMDESYTTISYDQSDVARLDILLADTIRRYC